MLETPPAEYDPEKYADAERARNPSGGGEKHKVDADGADAENDSAVANKRPKYEGGGGMDPASFYGPAAAAEASAEPGDGRVKEERRDVSGDDSVENGGECETGKGM